MIARIREHDADVGERRLEQAGCNLTVLQRVLECRDVVDLDHARRFVERHGLADVALSRHRAAVFERRDRFVDRAVIAAVVHDNFRPLRDLARPADRAAIGVGRGERELPVWDAEASRQFIADPGRIDGRQHQGDALARLAGDGLDRRGRRMARHAAGIAEAEVDELIAVHVREAGACGTVDVDGMIAGPARHPVHGHAKQ